MVKKPAVFLLVISFTLHMPYAVNRTITVLPGDIFNRTTDTQFL
jgi:hypothetical protein